MISNTNSKSQLQQEAQAHWRDREKCQKSLSFVMAGYNEEENVAKAVQIVRTVLSEQIEDYEIILINDGSTDHTLQCMQTCAEQDPHIRVIDNMVNLNYGASVLRGMYSAQKEWVFYDAFDLQMHPMDFVKSFIALQEDVDLVVYQRETYEAVFWRKLASLLNRGLLWLLFPRLIQGTPVLNHTQLLRRDCLEVVLPKSRSPIFFSPELVFRAKKKGLYWKNERVPFHSINGVRAGAFGHLYDMLWAIQDMLRFRILLWEKKI